MTEHSPRRRNAPWVNRRRSALLQGSVNVTYRCNAHCYMCHIWQNPTKRAEEFEPEILEKLPDTFDRLCIAGGEPMLRDDIVEIVIQASGRRRPLFHVPLPLVHTGLRALELLAGASVFATWEEAELMEVPMTSRRDTADAERLGVEPRSMGDVLGARG